MKKFLIGGLVSLAIFVIYYLFEVFTRWIPRGAENIFNVSIIILALTLFVVGAIAGKLLEVVVNKFQLNYFITAIIIIVLIIVYLLLLGLIFAPFIF